MASRNHIAEGIHLLLYNETFDAEEDYFNHCRKLLKEQISIVSVELASKTFLRSITDKRISFLGQLSSLGIKTTTFVSDVCQKLIMLKISGGTLGLFTGMSLLSFVEILFWCSKGFLKLISPQKV